MKRLQKIIRTPITLLISLFIIIPSIFTITHMFISDIKIEPLLIGNLLGSIPALPNLYLHMDKEDILLETFPFIFSVCLSSLYYLCGPNKCMSEQIYIDLNIISIYLCCMMSLYQFIDLRFLYMYSANKRYVIKNISCISASVVIILFVYLITNVIIQFICGSLILIVPYFYMVYDTYKQHKGFRRMIYHTNLSMVGLFIVSISYVMYCIYIIYKCNDINDTCDILNDNYNICIYKSVIYIGAVCIFWTDIYKHTLTMVKNRLHV